MALLTGVTLLLGGCAHEAGPSEPNGQGTIEHRPETPESTGRAGAEVRTAIAAALEATPANELSVEYFGFTDLSALDHGPILDALATTVGTGFEQVPQMGLDVFAVYINSAPELLPEPAPGASASTIGVPPDQASRFTGVPDPESVFARASAERTDLSGGTLIVRRPGFEIDLNDQEFLPALLARLNVIWHDGSTTITGISRQAVTEWVEHAGASLADHYDGAAECLGEPVGALLVSADFARTSGDVGIGIEGAPGDAIQTLCLRTDDVSAAVSEIRERLASGRDDMTGRPLSELVPDPVVDETGPDWVRVRTQGGQPGVFSQMLLRGGLYNVTG